MSVGDLCKLFGKTRQSFYYRENYTREQQRIEMIVLELVYQIRRTMPRLGTQKLHICLKQSFKTHGIKMGRDKLHELLRKNGMQIKRRRGAPKTTHSRHWLKKYPNLIRERVLTESEQLWVADITYICVGYDFNFLSLITDAYSHKIVGYCLYPTLSAQGSLHALDMALRSRLKRLGGLIHHSDRGVQYCCFEYVMELNEAAISISMTEEGEPHDNQIAERMNGILKTEFGLSRIFQNSQEAKIAVVQAIEAYNNKRPHMSCNYLTPAEAHGYVGDLQKRWRNNKSNNFLSKPSPEFCEGEFGQKI